MLNEMLIRWAALPASVDLLLRATILLAALWIAYGLSRKAAARRRALPWRTGLAGLVALPLVWAVGPRIPLAEVSAPAPTAPSIAWSSAPPTQSALPAGFYSTDPAGQTEPQSAAPVSAVESEAARRPFQPPLTQAAAALWLSGVLGFVGWLLLQQQRVGRIIRRGGTAPEEAHALLSEVAPGVAGKKLPRLQTSDEIGSPFLAGFFRPVIVLPISLFEADDSDTLRAVLAHELAHWRRGDLFWSAAIEMTRAVLWFHPLVHPIRSVHASACEEAADADAARIVGSGERYAASLAQVALALLERRPAPALTVPMARMPEIRRRLLRVRVSGPPAPFSRAAILTVSAAVLSGSLLLAAADAERAESGNKIESASSEAATASLSAKVAIKKLDKKIHDFEINETSLRDTMKLLGERAEIDFVFATEVDSNAKITVSLEDVTVRDALDAIATVLGLSWEQVGGIVVLRNLPPRAAVDSSVESSALPTVAAAERSFGGGLFPYPDEEIAAHSPQHFLEKYFEGEGGLAAIWALEAKAEESPEVKNEVVEATLAAIAKPSTELTQHWVLLYLVAGTKDLRGLPVIRDALLEHENETVRGVAACALGYYPPSESNDIFREALQREKSEINRGWIVRAMGGEWRDWAVPAGWDESYLSDASRAAAEAGHLVEAATWEVKRALLRDREGNPWKDKIGLEGLFEKATRDGRLPSALEEDVARWIENTAPTPAYQWRLYELLAEIQADQAHYSQAADSIRQALRTYLPTAYTDPCKHSKYHHLMNELAGYVWQAEGRERAETAFLDRVASDTLMQCVFLPWWRDRYERHQIPSEFASFAARVEEANQRRAANGLPPLPEVR